jgi:hypothetical protein
VDVGSEALLHLVLADAVRLLHFAVVLFVIGGLAVVWIGNRRGWRWVNGLRFRLLHLAAIACVVAQAWLGAVCPLTTLEMHLRAQAGEQTYSGGFIAHWVGRLLYHEAPDWVFTLAYSLFALAVALSWIRFPPVAGRRRKPSAH